MSSKHLFIEQWTPRPAWVARTPAERRAFADAVLGAIEAMKAGGIRTLGWGAADYARWSDRLLRSGTAFVTPSTHRGEPMTRFAIISPRTTLVELTSILASMA